MYLVRGTAARAGPNDEEWTDAADATDQADPIRDIRCIRRIRPPPFVIGASPSGGSTRYLHRHDRRGTMSHHDLTRRDFLSLAGATTVASTMGFERWRSSSPGIDPADVERWMRLASVPGLALAEVRGGRVEVRGWGVRRAGDAASSVDG